jgi:branched-chain amino acid transport system substrate-binding protein
MAVKCWTGKSHTLVWSVFVCVAAGLMVFLTGCDRQIEPVKVGFVASLTGRTSDVGLAARNGALLAIKQVNSAGGVQGHPVELAVLDIGNDPDKARGAVKELTSQGVSVAIGPVLSSMAVVLAPLADDAGLLMVSPTASTNMLGGKDDLFLRIYPQTSETSTKLASYVYRKQHRRVAIIADLSNRAFTDDWRDDFKQRFENHGGEIVSRISYTSGANYSFLDLAAKAVEENPDGLLILSSAIDAAMIAQQVIKMNKNLPIYVSEWSFTPALLAHGGRTVEGVSLFHTYNEQSQIPRFLKFVKDFKQNFGSAPSFPAIHAYDATSMVLAGLQRGARSGVELKQELLQIGEYESLQTSFTLNEFGDVKRELYLTEVRDGRFVVVAEP